MAFVAALVDERKWFSTRPVRQVAERSLHRCLALPQAMTEADMANRPHCPRCWL